MPYELKGNCVYKGDKKLKCYDNHADALAYFRALKLNVHESIHELPMVITKSSIASNGIMRWAAVNSDINWDLYGERMSLELYQKMIGYIKNNVPPPEQFKSAVCSDYWCGGMPYVSIAHYGDGNGKAVPGEVLELFVDGGQLKAKGVLFGNDLGKAVYKSLKEDEKINPQNEDKIRISIGFLDLAHKHGDNGNVFHRKSLTSVCPDCVQGVGNKIYLDGYLVHLALTRVPVNPRTEMKVDKSMTKPKTKKQDALSVVKEEALVEEIIAENGVEEKSALVEMSEAEETPATELEVPALVEDSKMAKETPEEDKTDSGEEMPDEEMEKKHKEMKSLTAEDVAEIVKSVLASTTPQTTVVETPAPVTQKSALDESVEKLYTSIKSAVESNAPLDEKLQSIQPQLEELGNSIITTVKSSVSQAPEAVANDSGLLLQAVQELSQNIKVGFDTINGKIAILEEKALTAPNLSVEQPRVPVPRSVSPGVVSTALQAKAQSAPKPGSVAEIARRSVGL